MPLALLKLFPCLASVLHFYSFISDPAEANVRLFHNLALILVAGFDGNPLFFHINLYFATPIVSRNTNKNEIIVILSSTNCGCALQSWDCPHTYIFCAFLLQLIVAPCGKIHGHVCLITGKLVYEQRQPHPRLYSKLQHSAPLRPASYIIASLSNELPPFSPPVKTSAWEKNHHLQPLLDLYSPVLKMNFGWIADREDVTAWESRANVAIKSHDRRYTCRVWWVLLCA